MTKLALLTCEVDLELGVCPVVQDCCSSSFFLTIIHSINSLLESR